MLARGGNAIFNNTSDPQQPWERLAGYLEDNRETLFMVNLESPIGELPAGLTKDALQWNLCADSAEISLLKQAGIDLVTGVNNHAQDCEVSDPQTDENLLLKNGIKTVEEENPFQLIDWNGKQIAILAINEISRSVDLEKYAEQIQTARSKSDLVVVSVHWGIEYRVGPTQRQRELAQELINAGADLVWGHHPHVLQKMEWMTSEKDGHEGLIIYSLGNLLADQWMLPETQRTVLIRIDFSRHTIKAIRILPLQMKISTRKLNVVREQQLRDWISDRLTLDDLSKPGVRVHMRTH